MDTTLHFSDLKKRDTLEIIYDKSQKPVCLVETGLKLKIAKVFLGAVITGALCSYLKTDVKQSLFEYALNVYSLQTDPLAGEMQTYQSKAENSPKDWLHFFYPVLPYAFGRLFTSIGTLYLRIKYYPTLSTFLKCVSISFVTGFVEGGFMKIYGKDSTDNEDAITVFLTALKIGVLVLFMQPPIVKFTNVPSSYHKWQVGSEVTSLALILLFQSKHSPLYQEVP